MYHTATKSFFVSALLVASVFVTAASVSAQEVVMVYASNITTTNALSNVNATLTPELLAKEFSKELTAELNVRLPKEQSELGDSLRIRAEYNSRMLAELDARLREEMSDLKAVVTD